MLTLFKPAKHKELLPKDKIDGEYKKLRLKVFLGIFIGYAGYYLVRKNFTLAMPYLKEAGYTDGDLGLALSAVSIAYGISKFFMGSVSDRSNARVFLAIGLLLSAITMIFMGMSPWATSSIAIMFGLLFVNGWFQGMGWPPCGRVMVHWFSVKERGVKMSFWNIAHNIGGGLMAPLAMLGVAIFGNWHSIFYFPALVSLLVVVVIWWLVRDTPQSCGLPPIEIYKNDARKDYSEKDEKEFSTKQIFFEHVFNNKFLWIIAFANAFVYLVRYGVIDWAPTYLKEAKGMDFTLSGWAYFGYECAGIFGTILCGWLSDKVFRGRRAAVNIIYMLLVAVAVYVYWKNPAGNPLVDYLSLFAIGFLIYGPVMLIGVQALDAVPKKAAGTAAGFTGFFAYMVGGAIFANIIMGYIFQHFGWNGGFMLLIAACFISMFLMLFTLRMEKKEI